MSDREEGGMKGEREREGGREKGWEKEREWRQDCLSYLTFTGQEFGFH